MPDDQKIETFCIQVAGLVQGVGFRPFIYRLATASAFRGWVENRNDGVHIVLNASRQEAEGFLDEIRARAPQASRIESVQMMAEDFREQSSFHIRESKDLSAQVTVVSPDIAVCKACIDDMLSQAHRIAYPFINCTHCGPRFTIIRKLPYDRPNTTMDAFEMCPVCRAEYQDVNNRRFHAQPVACNHCGPVYTMKAGGADLVPPGEILFRLVKGIEAGGVYALKGMGGYHLLCDAFNPVAVNVLRGIKLRDAKPFAVMFACPGDAMEYVAINREEEQLLSSWQRPIVLLKKKTDFTRGIADGLSSLGIMLPYMPIHHQLFSALNTRALVLTSGNLSDEPILIRDEAAQLQFGDKLAGVLSYNREIHNRCDDSVAMILNDKPMIMRRSRGYVPLPLETHMETEGIFAAGGELSNSFALGKGKQAYMSQYIGDLKNLETYGFYRQSYERFSSMFRFTPGLLVHDLHPDYLSTRFAKKISKEEGGLTLMPVQHHHAHIASVMLEKGLEGEVIGFSYDGLGYGDDGRLWGAEVMVAGYGDYQRMFHFEYLPLPGGDRANKEPWRMALAYLNHCYGPGFRDLPLPVFSEVPPEDVDMLSRMLKLSLNSPLISSAGRLFDAVAAILGINYHLSYQAEAAMKLEALADPAEEGSYPYELRGREVSFKPMIHSLVDDLLQKQPVEKISARFHNTMVEVAMEIALFLRKKTEINRVVLSGGSFQNRNLSGRLIRRLRDEEFEVFIPGRIPVNDQGIALGQLAIGAFRMKESGN